jgi:hypothetical protein
MKKIFAIGLLALSFAACGDADNDDRIESNEMNPDTVATTTTTTTSYSPVDGDVIYRDEKVFVMRNGAWVEADEDVKLDNGVVVHKDGHVIKDDREIELNDGEMVNKSGDFFDRTGVAIENAWDDTKRGVKKAGKAVGNAAEKLGDKTKDAVDGDNDNK